MPFQKGHKIGHHGRQPGAGRKPSPKTIAKRMVADMRIDAGKEAFECELDLMRRSKLDSIKMGCAQDIQDRVFGKAKQQMEHSGEVTMLWEKILRRSWHDA